MAWRREQLGFYMAGDAAEVLDACENASTPSDVAAKQEDVRELRAFASELEAFKQYQGERLAEMGGFDERETSDSDIWQ